MSQSGVYQQWCPLLGCKSLILCLRRGGRLAVKSKKSAVAKLNALFRFACGLKPALLMMSLYCSTRSICVWACVHPWPPSLLSYKLRQAERGRRVYFMLLTLVSEWHPSALWFADEHLHTHIWTRNVRTEWQSVKNHKRDMLKCNGLVLL